MKIKIKILLSLFIIPVLLHAQVDKDLKTTDKVEHVIDDADQQLKAYYKLTNEPGLLNRGTNTVYKDENLSAIQFPVGGVGTGCIQYDGNAVPRYWQIFNNMGHDFYSE